MALWGNNDNLVSSGTVSLNYATKVVTGSGTTFGTTGFGEVGDVIRFGTRGGGGTYYGEAIITEVTSATNITIASTDTQVFLSKNDDLNCSLLSPFKLSSS